MGGRYERLNGMCEEEGGKMGSGGSGLLVGVCVRGRGDVFLRGFHGFSFGIFNLLY